jgi:hypothetical protein
MNEKIKKLLSIILTVFLLNISVSKVEAINCTYGRYDEFKPGEWNKYVVLKIDGWNEYTLSHESAIVGVTDASKLKYDDEDARIDYVLLGQDSPCYNGKLLFTWAGAKCSEAFTYTVNLFVTQESYEITGGYCPERVEVCRKEEYNSIFATWVKGADDLVTSFYIYKDSLTDLEVKSKAQWFYDTSTHVCITLNEESIKDKEYLSDIEYGECATFNDYLYVLNKAKEENGGSCENNAKFTEAYRSLSNLCTHFSASTTYTGDNAGEQQAKTCMTECSKIKDHVSKICGYTPTTSITQECNSIGDRLLAWMFKIINMVRYAIPAILIILGVLDFIKAIASDSDEEIKKAGGRFAKRLLAAAILFIIPLILQFLLGIFSIPGLDPSNPFCVL